MEIRLAREMSLFSVTTFIVVVGATSFGVTLAFGLGCKDLARDMVTG